MHVITFSDLKKFAEVETNMPLNTDETWGEKEMTIYPPKRERVYFRLFTNLKRPERRPNGAKDANFCNHELTNEMVYKLVHHFQKTKVFPLGRIKVIP